MTDITTQVIVLQGSDGAFYALPLHVVRGYRVSEELRDTLAATLAESAEVHGHGMPATAFAMGGLFEVEDYSFDIEQTLNIGSQSRGAGAGKITFNPFSSTRKQG